MIEIKWNGVLCGRWTRANCETFFIYILFSIMEQIDSTFRYVYSSALEQRVMIKMYMIFKSNIDCGLHTQLPFDFFSDFSGTLEGLKHKPDYEKLLENPLLRFSGLYLEQCPPLMVRLQLYNNGEPFGLPVTTSYKSFSKRYKWVVVGHSPIANWNLEYLIWYLFANFQLERMGPTATSIQWSPTHRHAGHHHIGLCWCW